MGESLENLQLSNEPLPDVGWSSYLELDVLIVASQGLDLDDDPGFARFCEILRSN